MLPIWLFTTKAKLIGAGILILVLGYAYRRQIVKAEERGAQQKEIHMLAEEGKRIDAIVAEKLAQYDQERAELQARVNALAGERNALLVQRDANFKSIRDQISQIAKNGSQLESEIRSVPADALDGRIRAALARARVSDSELARIRSAQ
jgi:hypothetical protein